MRTEHARIGIPLVVSGGPTPVETGIRRCNDVLAQAGDDRKAMATALFTRAKFEAMRGEIAQARELVARARTLLEDIALTVWLAGPFTQMAAWVEILAGDHQTAEAQLRWGVETLPRSASLSFPRFGGQVRGC